MIDEYPELFTRIRTGQLREGLPYACPQISHIDGNLWHGGTPAYGLAPAELLPFDYVVNIDPAHPYGTRAGAQMKIFRWHDSKVYLPPMIEIQEAAATINEWLALGPTLVHCEGGWNRSGLAIGVALVAAGLEPDAAIELLRRRRSPAVLYNPLFESFVRGLRRG